MARARSMVPLWAAASLCSAAAQAGSVVVEGRNVMVDGHPFVMQGVCYAPNPIGHSGEQPPNGDFFTSAWRSIYLRDLPLMRDMGVNTIRVYGWAPGADHSEFLDLAWNGGHRPIHVLINRWIDPNTDWTSPGAVSILRSEWSQIATNAMSHPATLGYVIGNELNGAWWNPSLASLWPALDSIAGEIRRVDACHVVTTALSDYNLIASIAAHDAQATNFNAWCIQVYRGSSFKTLFTDYAQVSGRPLFVTEFGLDAFDLRTGAEYADDAAEPAAWILGLWNEIATNRPVASGGAVFEWADEWWKAGNSVNHDAGGWANGAFPDGQADEEWWGINRVAPGSPNILEPRAAFEKLHGVWWHPPKAPALTITSPATTTTQQVQLLGAPGFGYVLESSETLSNWAPLQTNAASFFWTNASAPNASHRFFRAFALP